MAYIDHGQCDRGGARVGIRARALLERGEMLAELRFEVCVALHRARNMPQRL